MSLDKCIFEGVEITKTQKAQGIVEFALVLPLFLLLVMGIIYFGMAFSDYLTMSNSVRSIAHDASLRQTDADYRNVVINNTRNIVLQMMFLFGSQILRMARIINIFPLNLKIPAAMWWLPPMRILIKKVLSPMPLTI